MIHFADGSVLPETFAVSEGYPNPFNPAVTFTITLLNGGPVEFKVFNSLGQEVNTVSVVMTSGEHRYSLDMRDFLADPVSGMYFVSVRHGSTGVLRKILLLR